MALNFNREPFMLLDLDAIRRDNPVADVAAGAGVELKLKGAEMVGLCPFHSERTPSFTIYDGGHRFQCFGCGAGGDVLDFVQALHGVGLREAGELLGGGKLPVVALPPVPADDSADRVEKARAIWQASHPIEGTVAQTYLRRRAIRMSLPDCLRFAVLRHPDTRRSHPSLVAAVENVEGEVVGVHRIFLTDDGSKLDVAKSKLSKGRIAGGAIRLEPVSSALVVAEGIEDALSLLQETGRPAWAAGGAGMLSRMQFPSIVRSVAVGGDNDATGKEQAEKAARAFAMAGIEASTFFPSPAHKDFNSELMEAR